METFVSPILIASAIITAGSAIATVIVSMHNSRKLDLIHMQFNSRVDQLITQTGLAKFAEGGKAERDKLK